MANVTYDLRWQEAMAELTEQLHIEDPTLALRDGESVPQQGSVSLQEANQHWSCLYIKYLEIFRNLEACYDGMVHPQKRIEIKLVMELVMSRVLELKAHLVKWNPPHPTLSAAGVDGPFPWEYVNFDDVLVDLKLPPKALEVPIPRYFTEEFADNQAARDRLVNALKMVKLGNKNGADAGDDQDSGATDGPSLLLERGRSEAQALQPLIDMTIEEAVACIQRCERGRQGIVRGQLAKFAAQDSNGPRRSLAASALNTDPEVAASNIQRHFRGAKARRKALEERDRELAFIGMRRSNQWDDPEERKKEEKLFVDISMARSRRKTEQKDNEEGYSQALINLHGSVLEEEGPDMREKMIDERRAWFTEELGKGTFPEDLSGFYLTKYPPPEAEEGAEDAKGGKGGKGKDGGKKDAKGKGKGGDGDEEAEKIPPLSGSSIFSRTLADCLDRYRSVWLDRDERDNFQQKHDVELAKNVVRPNVEEEVREHVDKMLVLQLQNLKSQLEAAASGGKKGKKKGKKDKKKGKKGKKDKKGKGKKGKALPGEKLCAGMELEEMLGILIENGVVKEVGDTDLSEMVGEFNFLGSAYQQHSEVRDAFGNWVPQDPSIPQVRQALTEHIVLPLGCSFLRVTAPYAKSALLYGPSGSGKTLMARGVAAHTRSLFLDISPEVLSKLPREYMEGKSGPTRFMHMVFACARHPSFGPAVIYVDKIDKIFVGKKKGAGGEAAKFRKDLVTYANSLKPEERVVLIGCTSEPFNIPEGEYKDIKAVFQRQLYLPFPDYGSRVQIWQYFLERRFSQHEMDVPKQIDVSVLALISEGYSAGAIKLAIEKTMTERRFATLAQHKVTEEDFVSPLSACPCSFQDDNVKFQAFTAAITGLRDRRDQVKSVLEGGGDGKKDAKKKKK